MKTAFNMYRPKCVCYTVKAGFRTHCDATIKW